jgi:uracil-DNA glycosylase
MAKQTPWDRHQQTISECERCPRLREHCLKVAETKRASFKEWTYWGKPVPDFGDPNGRLLIVGLAPAAHGANRTGRMFTGDRSGDFLFEALHATRFANQANCTDRDDGLELNGIAIAAAAHCAPPANKPTPDELTNCLGFLKETARLMPNLRGLIALGAIGWGACLKLNREMNWSDPKPKPKFGHGAVYAPPNAPFLIGTYHPSQQNTFTGRLTQAMFQKVFRDARKLSR